MQSMSGVYSISITRSFSSTSASINHPSTIEHAKISQQIIEPLVEEKELDIGQFSLLEAIQALPEKNPDKKTLQTKMTLAGYFHAMTYSTDQEQPYALYLLSALNNVKPGSYIETLIGICEKLEKGSTQILYHLLFSLHDHLGVKHPSLWHSEVAFIGSQASQASSAHRKATHQEKIEVVKRAQALELLEGIQIALELNDHESLQNQLDQLNSIQFDRNLPNLNLYAHLENQIVNYLLNPHNRDEVIDFEQGQQILRGNIAVDHLDSNHKKAAVNRLEKELREYWLVPLPASDKQ